MIRWVPFALAVACALFWETGVAATPRCDSSPRGHEYVIESVTIGGVPLDDVAGYEELRWYVSSSAAERDKPASVYVYAGARGGAFTETFVAR